MLENLCSKTLCYTLSKVFEISSEIVQILLLSSTLLILCGIIVKTTAVDLEKKNPNCLCVQVFVLVVLNNNLFDSKAFRMAVRLIRNDCKGDVRLSAFLKAGHAAKHFSRFRKQSFLNLN